MARKGVIQAAQKVFGSDHHFNNIRSSNDFKQAVPVHDYEDLKPYVNRVVEGEENILWPGKPPLVRSVP
jgi:hypothetical protein